MSKMCKKALTVLLAAVMFMAVASSALAGTVTFTIQDGNKGIDVTPGSSYTDTDLFGGFKDVMPGDTKTETITIENKRTDYDHVDVYLSVVPHSEGVYNDDGTLKSGNPLNYDEKYENTDGKDQSGVDGQRDETLESMQDFLNQLTMNIYTGTGDDKKLVAENVIPGVELTGQPLKLATINKNNSATLTVELIVPLEMDNRYAYRVGEVDWKFTVQGGNDGGGGGGSDRNVTVKKVWSGIDNADQPESITVKLTNKKGSTKTITLSKKNNWTYVLDDTYRKSEVDGWTVEEIGAEDYTMTTSTSTVGSNMIVLTITNSKGGGNTPEDPNNPNPPGGGETPGGETPGGSTDTPGGSTGSALTVVKAWEDNDAGKRPSAVCVTLFNGDEPVESVWLSAWNNWTYSWTDLGSGLWGVLETEIPAGYTPTYANEDGVVVITNVETLIKTGQVNWPVVALGGAGALMMLAGVLMLAGKKRQNAR